MRHSFRDGLIALVSELRRRRVYKVAAVYAVAAWLIVQVAATTFPLLGLPAWTATLVVVLVVLGFPVTLILAWLFDVTPQGIERTRGKGPAQVAPPPIRYARSGDVNIAYYTIGSGSVDLILVQGWISHLEYAWEEQTFVEFLQRLASFSRLIVFDKRGTGLSDRAVELPALEQRMDDVRAVMEAAGSERAVVFGYSEGGPMSMLFAAMYPERTLALVLYASYAKRIWSPDYPWAPTPEQRQGFYDLIEKHWGKDQDMVDLDVLAPSMVANPRFCEWWATYMRRSASPGAALALARMNTQIDVRHVLPSIRVPTLVLHRTEDRDMNVEESRYIASRMPGAKFVELSGQDHIPWVDSEQITRVVETFVRGLGPVTELDRVLITVMFVEAVDFAGAPASLRDLAHPALTRFRGRQLETADSGLQAIFDGPARAVRCACAIRDAATTTGVSVRVGLHTGECEVSDNRVSGVPTHLAREVARRAKPGEVMVTNTIKDIVAGSGLRFEEQREEVFADSAGSWKLFVARER